MRNAIVLDLADCAEYRQVLLARPPRLVHGAAALLALLIAGALTWAGLTRANLVVRAPGRVRPVAAPQNVFNAARGGAIGIAAVGRVVEVNAREGDVVRLGDVLIRLDTEQLEVALAGRRRAVRAAEEELAELDRLEAMLVCQSEADRARAEAELEQARREVERARQRRASEVRLAELALQTAEEEEGRTRLLAERRVAATADLAAAVAKLRTAREELAMARLPIDEGRVSVLERALELLGRDYDVRREELELKRDAKRAELEAARTELANLELERGHAVIRAPIDGIVTMGDIKVGDVLEPGKPVAAIAPQAGFRFEAAVPSDEVGHLSPGMPTRIKLDAYDYQRYGTLAGTVRFISPDSGAAEDREAAVYVVRIEPARDEVGRGGTRGRVKLGMTGQVEIVTGSESLLWLLVRRIQRTISLG